VTVVGAALIGRFVAVIAKERTNGVTKLVRCWCFLFGLLIFAPDSQAQYKGDHIPGFLGLESGTQAPPGLYVGNLVWVYPTSTIKDDTGKASALRLVVLGAFAISCWVIMHESLVAGQVSSELFLGWLGIWVTAALGGKGIEAWRSKP